MQPGPDLRFIVDEQRTTFDVVKLWWFRYFTGTIQIAGALLMLTPWTLTVGAAMLTS